MKAVGRVVFLLLTQASLVFTFGDNETVLYCIAICLCLQRKPCLVLCRFFLYRSIACFRAFLVPTSLCIRAQRGTEPRTKTEAPSHSSTGNTRPLYQIHRLLFLLHFTCHAAVYHHIREGRIQPVHSAREHGLFSKSLAMAHFSICTTR